MSQRNKNNHKVAKLLKYLAWKKEKMQKFNSLTIWKETIYLKNIQYAQRTIDRLPLEVEKNVLYDVGGEMQRVLEENLHLKLGKGNEFYEDVDRMLRVVIKVREKQNFYLNFYSSINY